MSKKLIPLLRSMRLRTLPLSLAGIITGLGLAAHDHTVRPTVTATTLLTAALLQILSNLSNELGDYLSGTDTDGRTGPAYSLQSGTLSPTDLRTTIIVLAILCCLSGTAMIWLSFGTLLCTEAICLLLLGAAAVWAAIRYTLGRNPYGYRGLGDIFVFLFFGIASVGGTYFVATHTFVPWVLLPASAIGLFSIGVLNTNNIRDMETDAGTRVTIPLKFGLRNARIYQTALIGGGWLLLAFFLLLHGLTPWHWLCVITMPLYIAHLQGVWIYTGRQLDKMLPLLVMTTFLLSCILSLTYIII
ncbi:MAG: 1,4-dihydroxy-2-naphthoate octaprenyltransferase [Bacteroidales bacterium]|nr:1,4-dihydroxy-2-naphthoate octaprenyltransferase [Bacteroidales bacterium]